MKNKKYIWCFMGQVHLQGERGKMIDRLKGLPGEHYCNVNKAWLSSDSVSTKDYKNIMKDSVFTPCPRGNSSVDSFRLYEALEAGTIPIIEKDESWKILLGDHPLLETDSEWNSAYKYIEQLINNEQFLERYLDKIQTWWSSYKSNLSDKINKIIVEKKYKDKVYYNPTSIRYKDKKYILYRTDKYPEESLMDYQNVHGEEIDFERSLFGYSLKTISGEGENMVECYFNVKNGSYKETRTIDLPDNQYEKPEDIKFIQNTFEEKDGDLYCLATCNAIVQSKVTSGSKLKNGNYDKTKKMNVAVCVTPAFCEINLTKGIINYIDMIGSTKNVTRQKSYEKNWAVLKEHGMYYCIYSVDPLIYESATSLKDIKFDDQVFGSYVRYHSPCNPYFYNGKYYLIVHERLKDHHYILEKSLVTFEIRNYKIEQVERTKLDFKDEAYCSGLYVDAENIEIYAGYNDIETKRVVFENPIKQKKEECLKLSNPSCIRRGDNYFALFRGEDFSEQIEDIKGGKMGIVQSLIYTEGTYWMKIFDLDLRVIDNKQMKFDYLGNTYSSFLRKDAKGDIAAFEDLRMIEGSDFINESGELCALATCAMLTKHFWKGYAPYAPGLCEVNFSTQIIKFKKFLLERTKEVKNHKNWVNIKTDGGMFTIASVFPLAYQFSKFDDIGISNSGIIGLSENAEYRNSCQPIKIEKNKYGMLCHQKNGTKYNYIWVDIFVNGRSLEIIDSREIIMPDENAYCSSVFFDKDKKDIFCMAGVNNFSYEIYDLEIFKEEREKAADRLGVKKKEFLKLKSEWSQMVDRDYLKYLNKITEDKIEIKDKFSKYNAGKKIAMITLYTKEIASYAKYSEQNIKDYCLKQGYTFYVYRDSLDNESSPNWSKARAIMNHIEDHEELVWIDADTIIFNPEKKFEDILARCVPQKKIIACEDIGTNNQKMPKGSMFNSGVVIFRNHQYTKNIIKQWMNFEGDKSSLYASGGDQEILCNIIKKVDGFGNNLKVFPMNQFNTEPRLIDENTFVVHFMAFPYELKCLFIRYFVSS